MMKRKTYLFLGAALFAAAAIPNFASANLLANPGFEVPPIDPAGPPEYFGAPGWTDFGGTTFTVGSAIVPPNSGDQALKMFAFGGVFQDFPAQPGQTWNGGVWMRNHSGDLMTGGQVAAVNIEWLKADMTNSDITPFISNGTFTAADAPVDVWTLQTITGDAPADAAFARLVLITGDFLGQPAGGAPFFDDAFFEVIPDPGTLTLLSVGVFALIRRRR